SVVVPAFASSERPGAVLGDSVPPWIGRLETRELGPRVGIERGPQSAGELAGAERPEDRDLGRFKSLRDPLGLLDQRGRGRVITSVAYPVRVDLDRDQNLVLLSHAGGGPDQLEIGLDDRCPARWQCRVTLGMDPSGELVPLRGGS